MNEIQESSENIVKMLDSVQVVKQLITDPINRQLHFIKHSKRFTKSILIPSKPKSRSSFPYKFTELDVSCYSYINKVAGLFDQKETAIEKMIASQKALKIRKEEALLNENELKPQLKLIMDKTRQLQEQVRIRIFFYGYFFLIRNFKTLIAVPQVELEISKKYKNRPVNLIGGF